MTAIEGTVILIFYDCHRKDLLYEIGECVYNADKFQSNTEYLQRRQAKVLYQ